MSYPLAFPNVGPPSSALLVYADDEDVPSIAIFLVGGFHPQLFAACSSLVAVCRCAAETGTAAYIAALSAAATAAAASAEGLELVGSVNVALDDVPSAPNFLVGCFHPQLFAAFGAASVSGASAKELALLLVLLLFPSFRDRFNEDRFGFIFGTPAALVAEAGASAGA